MEAFKELEKQKSEVINKLESLKVAKAKDDDVVCEGMIDDVYDG